ncbi:GDSL-type esterase/lipase family protein [Actinomyces mediterranea]|uniref:GDSL-type esterase/lipase family protein n=1 Tax=Actinomyces mediterranea TaxID=1871028 RepID=UPI0009705AA8|nr:GDSL-type esterase/lipase family protein [Actinomyces mediterranea]
MKRQAITALAALGLIALPFAAAPTASAVDPDLRLNAVVIGDSYSAGNGAGAYEPGTKGTSYRSTRNWARVYTAWLNSHGIHTTLTNLAVSGSVTSNVLNEQIPRISEETDLVMLTIGGNDIEFSTIVSSCFAAGLRSREDCVNALDTAESGLDATIDATRTILERVNDRIGDDGHVVLLAYPLLATTREYALASCAEYIWTIDGQCICMRYEQTDVGSRVRSLGTSATAKQKALVDSWNASHKMKVSFIDSIPQAFDGHEPDPSALHRNPARWINEFFETEGVESGGNTSSKWSTDKMNFYHPNITGHRMMADEIQKNVGVSFSAEPIQPGLADIDIVFVVDATGSMKDDIGEVRANVTGIVSKIESLTDSHRFALVTYKDFADQGGDEGDYPARVELDFTSDPQALRSALDAVSVDGGGDWPETVYSGVTAALDLPWRAGVRKIAIVLGDAPAKNPEPVTGHTAHSAAVHALAVDPVEVYAVDTGSLTSVTGAFQDLVDETGGKAFSLRDSSDVPDRITEAITTALDKPFGWLQGPISGEVGESLDFDARGSYALDGGLTSYEWDFDSDGLVDETTTTGFTQHVFTEPFEGIASVQVTDSAGKTAKGSAPLSVVVPPEPEPEPEVPADRTGVIELLDGAPLPTPDPGASQSGDPSPSIPPASPSDQQSSSAAGPGTAPKNSQESDLAHSGSATMSVGVVVLLLFGIGSFILIARTRRS